MAYEEFRRKIVDLQGDWGLFQIDFIDRDSFKDFADHLDNNLLNTGYDEVCITGYFSETIREALEHFSKMQGYKVRLICQELDPKKPREMKNLDVLRRLCKTGVEVKVNSRIHARFLVAHMSKYPETCHKSCCIHLESGFACLRLRNHIPRYWERVETSQSKKLSHDYLTLLPEPLETFQISSLSTKNEFLNSLTVEARRFVSIPF